MNHRLRLMVLFGLLVLTSLGCTAGSDNLTADDRLRFQDACKGREDVSRREADSPTDTVPGSMLSPEEATDERAAAVAYRQVYCACLVDRVEGVNEADRVQFVTDPPESARSDCESVASDRLSEMELGEFLPEDPLKYLNQGS